MDQNKLTFVGLRNEIDSALLEIKTLHGGILPEDFLRVLDRYLKTPGNPIDHLFNTAGLDKDNPVHWRVVLWHVSALIYQAEPGHKDGDWGDVEEIELLARATIVRIALELTGQPRRISDVCLVLKNDRSWKHVDRRKVERTLKDRYGSQTPDFLFNKRYEDMEASALETRLHATLTKYESMMISEHWREQFTADELQSIEAALNSFRSGWRKD